MWLVSAFDYFKCNSNIVSNGFKKAGIMDAIEGQQCDEHRNNYERGYVPQSPYPILTQNSHRLIVVRETEKRTAKN